MESTSCLLGSSKSFLAEQGDCHCRDCMDGCISNLNSFSRINSKSQAADLQLGDNMNISRQHAKIAYDKETKSWLMTVQGKNGCTVNGEVT